MKVLIDGGIFQMQSHGGVSRIYKEIFPKISDLDSNCELILTHKHSIDLFNFIFKKIFYLEPRNRLPYYNQIKSYLNALIRLYYLKNEKEIVYHATYYNIPDLWSGKIIVSVFDLIHEKFPSYVNEMDYFSFIKIKEQAIKKADKIISISESTKKDLITYYGISKEKIEVIPLGVSDDFNLKLKYEGFLYNKLNFSYFLYVGRKSLYKNINILYLALQNCEFKNYKLVLVSSPLEKREIEYLKKLGIYNQIIVFSNIHDKDLAYLYKNAKCFVYPSIYEGFGIPLLEAARMKVKIVCSNIPSSVEVIKDGAIYFDPNSVESLVDALLKSFESNNSIIEKAYNYASLYSWEICAEKTLDLYYKLSNF